MTLAATIPPTAGANGGRLKGAGSGGPPLELGDTSPQGLGLQPGGLCHLMRLRGVVEDEDLPTLYRPELAPLRRTAGAPRVVGIRGSR